MWAVSGFSPDVLAFLDEAVHLYPMPHRAKRAFTFERQLVLAKQASCPTHSFPLHPSPTHIMHIMRTASKLGSRHCQRR